MDQARDLPIKLDMMLKAASLSRVELAHQLGVDKSLVGRWLAGTVHPSEHNLARLSLLLADHAEGFRLADWYLPAEDLARRYSMEIPTAPGVSPAEPILGEFREAVEGDITARGSAYEGFWRTSRPSLLMPGELFHDYGIIRRTGIGLVEVKMSGSGLDFTGHLFPFAGNIIVYLFDRIGRSPVTVMCRGVTLPRAMVLDGIIMLAALDPARTPAAFPLLVERVGDITGDAARDDATYAELADLQPQPLDPIGDKAIKARIYRDSGPSIAAQGGDAFLSVSAGGSLSRGSTGRGLKG